MEFHMSSHQKAAAKPITDGKGAKSARHIARQRLRDTAIRAAKDYTGEDVDVDFFLSDEYSPTVYEVSIRPTSEPNSPLTLLGEQAAADERSFRKVILSDPRLQSRGVYFFMDAHRRVLYVGQSADSKAGLAARLIRHLAYSKTDAQAQNRIAVSEIAYVGFYALPESSVARLREIEKSLVAKFAAEGHPVMQTIGATTQTFDIGEPVVLQVIPDTSIHARLRKEREVVTQIDMFKAAFLQTMINPTPGSKTCADRRFNLLMNAFNSNS
jgi:hypothetical protein